MQYKLILPGHVIVRCILLLLLPSYINGGRGMLTGNFRWLLVFARANIYSGEANLVHALNISCPKLLYLYCFMQNCLLLKLRELTSKNL